MMMGWVLQKRIRRMRECKRTKLPFRYNGKLLQV